jgi:ADP-ribose pyrophosphatase
VRYHVLADERIGEDGYLRLRRLRVQVERDDGSLTKEGRYDFVERPSGRDAVVVVLWRRVNARVEILLRRASRVPLAFDGSPLGLETVAARPIVELVAGIIEPGDALMQRAADEAHEEAGVKVAASAFTQLGGVMLPTPGMFPERFTFVAAKLDANAAFAPPAGDGSPFEEGATLAWRELHDAIAACRAGEIEDLKTEVGLVRLRDHFADK